MKDNLLKIFGNYVHATESDLKICEEYFKSDSSPKNTILEEENKIPENLYFITKGYMRLFYYDLNGDEVTTLIAPPNSFITSYLDFIHQKKSNQNLESITDCEYCKIERSKLAELIDKNENFKQFSLIIFERAMADTTNRANDLATLTAELRYKKLLNDAPEIIQHVPIQYIASFLGIKSQSLSRIRKQLIK
jgi:CRP-like cAMP-binding protein